MLFRDSLASRGERDSQKACWTSLFRAHILTPSIEVFTTVHAEELTKRFTKAKFERAVVYFEWVGPNSFAGSHPDPVELMEPVLIDIDVYKKGLMPPEKFVDFTAGMRAAELLHKGRITEEFFQSVRNRTLEGMQFEGIIGKRKEIDKGTCQPVMFKVKSNDWLNKLKEICNGDERLFDRLK